MDVVNRSLALGLSRERWRSRIELMHPAAILLESDECKVLDDMSGKSAVILLHES